MAADVAEEPVEEAAVQAADGGGRRHPRWGIAAQVAAIVGAIGLVLTIGVASCLFISAVLLPALLTLWSRLQYNLTASAAPATGNHSELNDIDMSEPHVPLSIYHPNDHAA